MEKLNLFFDKIKGISFWQRLFSWHGIKALSYDAFQEFKSIEKNLKDQQEKINELSNIYTKISTENENQIIRIHDFEKALLNKENQIEKLNENAARLNNDITQLNAKISKSDSIEENRSREYQKNIDQLNQAKKTFEDEHKRLNDERLEDEKKRFELMKQTWNNHETSVEQAIKLICQNYIINYVEKVPFQGKPDNTLEICGEYIIFDSKSPANDDLQNFPRYIKFQSENVKKYAGQENVKKDIFLVVPTNTIDTLGQLYYNMGDYNVYVITKDSLEPIILSLKKIEDYEFAEQLSPDERNNICRIIGKFAHTTKRKIQIDQFFATEFLELLVKCKNDLPEEILKQVIEFEKAEKLNPPSEKRAKQILTSELQDKNNTINAEAKIREIDIPANFDEVKKLE